MEERDDQLQPGDGLHRLRHQRPPLLRAPGRGERRSRSWPTSRARRAARTSGDAPCDRPVRGPDGHQPRRAPGARRRPRDRLLRAHRSTSPKTGASSSSSWTAWASPSPPGPASPPSETPSPSPSTSATPSWCAPPTSSAGGRWRSSPAPRTWSATCTRSPPRQRSSPSWWTSTSRAKRWRWTPSRTAESTLIPGIMEHIERAGVHSGDSFAVYPGINLTEENVEQLVDYTTASPPGWRCGAWSTSST